MDGPYYVAPVVGTIFLITDQDEVLLAGAVTPLVEIKDLPTYAVPRGVSILSAHRFE